jgi:hypothetical protein
MRVLKDVARDGEGLGPSDPLGTVSHVNNTLRSDVGGPDNISERHRFHASPPRLLPRYVSDFGSDFRGQILFGTPH